MRIPFRIHHSLHVFSLCNDLPVRIDTAYSEGAGFHVRAIDVLVCTEMSGLFGDHVKVRSLLVNYNNIVIFTAVVLPGIDVVMAIIMATAITLFIIFIFKRDTNDFLRLQKRL